MRGQISISLFNTSCNISIPQDSANLTTLIKSSCNARETEKLTAAYSWTRLDSSTCSWAGFTGDDTFTGIPSDNDVGICNLSFNVTNKSSGETRVFKTVITVTNLAPTLAIDPGATLQNSPLTTIKGDLDVQANEEGMGVYSSNIAGTTSPKCAENGTVVVNPTTGVVDFQPAINYVDPCYIGVQFDDQNGAGNSKITTNFVVNISLSNTTPTINGTCLGASTEDVAYSCNALSVFDLDVADVHTWSLTGANTCSWLAINSTTGVVTGTPTDNNVGTCTLALRVYDQIAYSNTYSRVITVANVVPTFNPVLTNPANLLEDSPVTIIKAAADVNATDEGFGIYTLENATTTAPKCSDNGVLAINSATGAVTFTPAFNYDGACNFKIQFDDQNPPTNLVAQELLLTMTAVNDPPVITSTCPTSINELAAYNCVSTYTDVENNPVTWAKIGTDTCSWLTVNPTTGQVTGTPARANVGTCVLAYVANDSYANSLSYTTTITVNNLMPVVNAVNASLAEDSAATIINTAAQVTSTDEGFGTYSIGTPTSNNCTPSRGTVSIDASTGELTFAPNVNFDTNCNIRVQFNDGKPSNNIGFRDITVTMIPSPDNAVVSLPAACNVTQNEDILYNCIPTKVDPDTGDTHNWTVESNTCSWVNQSSVLTGVMTGTPNDNNVGTCTFTIKATGNQDGLVTSSLVANITVNNVQPVLSGTNPVNILMNAAAANIQNITSTDENYGTYTLIPATSIPCEDQKAQPITIDPTTGVINYMPLAKFAGLCKINVRFDDENALDNIREYEFTVNVQDFIKPYIEYIDSPDDNTPTYQLGSVITIDVKFDEQIVINTTLGTPRIFLETGAIDRFAEYDSLIGVNLDTLRFKYTVQQGDLSSDLKVHATVSSLDLRDSVIADRFNNYETVYVTPTSGPNSLHEREELKVNGSVSIPTVTGLPTRVSPDVALNATVGGTDIISYRYKVTDITSPTEACTNATGYSGATIPVATLITDSLTAVPSGTTLRICVVGTNSLSIETPLADAFTYVWTKDLFSVAKVSFASVTNLANWQDSEVDPDNNNIIYAKNLLGEVYKSTDFGANWQLYCLVSQTYHGQIEVSPGPDRTPYVFQNGRAYKVINAAGGACTDLYALGGFTDPVATNYNIKNYDITANGDLYIGYISGANFVIKRSFDQGANWTLFATTSTSGTTAISFAINPVNSNTIIYSMYKYGPGAGPGVYISYDAGITKTLITGVFTDNYSNFKWDLYDTTYVFSGVSGNSHKSLTTGATWILDNGVGDFNELLFTTTYYRQRRWDIDKVTGHAYRMRTDGTHSYLEKATNLYSADVTVWTNLYTFSNINGFYDVGLSVSVSGNVTVPANSTITVNIKNQMFVSTDGGATFTEQYAVKELKLASITSFGDGAIYGATYDWAVVKTTDNGKNWVYKQFDYSQCLGVPPRIMVNREDNDKVLTWSENYSASNCANFNYSTNGMTSQISRDAFSIVAPALQVAMSINDPKNFYIAGKPTGNFIVNTTENNAYENLQSTLTGLEFTSPMPDSYISPVDKNKVWVIDNIDNGVFWEYDILNKTKTNLSANTGLGTIAALDSFVDINGAYGVRVMDRVGKLRVSNDFGATYSDEGAASGVLTSCNKRFLYHHPKDRTLLLTACLSTNLFAYSKDNGLNWTQIDTLTKFSIDCNIKGVALSSSKIFLACKNSDTFEFNYTSVENINVINDNILTVAEQLPATDLVNHLYPGTYSTIEYKVILANGACDGTTGYSLSVPQSNDPIFDARGGYRVCIKQLDGSGATTYTTSSVIFFDNTAPSFSSIALIGDASDGKITYVESFNQTPIVGNLISSNHDFVKYAVTLSANTCDGSLTYSYITPQSQNDTLKLAGNYKVCVQLTTKGNLAPVYGASLSFEFDPTTVIANITNTPVDFVSTDTNLDVIITGTNVTKYKYKIVSTSLSCKSTTDYSPEVPVGTKITDSLTTRLNGSHLKLCVIGSDNLDNWQSYEKATEFYWIHSKSLIATRLDLSGANTLSAWRNVAVHQSSPNIMYAINDMGEIFKTDNAGTNWQIMCRVNTYLNHMNLKLSPGQDATAYISANYTDSYSVIAPLLYRVDSRNGESCPSVVGDFRGTAEVNFYHSSLAIDHKGIIYLAETQYNMIVLRRSLDFGKSWQFVGQLYNNGVRAAVFIHPTNSNYMLITTKVSNGSVGLSRSSDGGATWTFTSSSASFTGDADIYFDPINAGRVYTNNGMFSTDYGATWAYDANLDIGTNRKWIVNSSGVAYQSTIFGGVTRLQKSTGLNPPAFVDVKTFATVGSDLHATVSGAGTNIAIIANKQLHISTDSGTTFTQIFWPGKYTRLSGIDSANGQKQYAVTTAMKIFTSANNGSAWTYKNQYYDEYCHRNTWNNPNYHRAYAHPIFPDTAYVFNTGCLATTFSTTDGFDTSVLMGRGAIDYSQFSIAPFATNNAKAVLFITGEYGTTLGRSHLTSDSFSTESSVIFTKKESLSESNVTPYGISYLGNEDITMHVNNGKLFEVRRDEIRSTTITGKLTFANPAAIRLTTDQNDLAYKYVVISATGQLNQSKDNGVSYQSFGNAAPGLTTCAARILSTYPNDSNIMATACYGGNDIAWTQDNGTTWQQYTFLTTYGMTCSLTGITVDHSKISFSCANNFDGLYFYHNPVNLANLASDNILLAGDADGDLVSIYNASKYVTIDYSLITEGSACNAGNTYSAVIPRKSDLVTNGNYQVCTKLFDGTTTRYVKSSVIHYSAVSPIFTSIDLVSASGVHLKDIVAAPASLVNNLVGSNYSNSYYALVDSATTCNDSITYSEIIPRTDSPLFNNAGMYKVCVALSNQSGQKVFGASSDFSYSKDSVYAKINNAPEGISSEVILNVTINGTLLDNYKYKIGESASVDCKVSAGYSASIPAATPITNDITALANGLIKLCVLGLNNDGKNQIAAQPTVHTWTKNTFNLATQNLSVKTKVNEWHDIVVTKNSPGRIYASTKRGRVFLSNDRGTTWEFQCQVPYDATSRIVSSNSSTPLAFISSGTEIYRIEHSPMPALCPSVTSTIGTLVMNFKRIPLVITNKNVVYIMEELNATTSYLKYSLDNGETWILKNTLAGIGPSINIFMNSSFDHNIHLSFEGSGNTYYSTENHGLSFENMSFPTLGSPTSPGDTLLFLRQPNMELKFDPAIPGRIYTNNNHYSSDDGTTWSLSNGFIDNFIRWDIANDGTAYRLTQNGANVEVRTATSASSAASTLYKTINTVTLDTNEAISLSGDEATIAVIIANKAFLSLDGANFIQIDSPDTTHNLASIASENSSTLYGVDYSWNYYKSTNGGVANTYMATYNTPCVLSPRIKTNKSNSNFVYSYAYEGATNTGCTQNMFSTDGLTTSTAVNSSFAAPAPVVALNQFDSTRLTIYGNTTVARSTNSAATFTSFTLPNVTALNQNPDGVMSTVNPQFSWTIPVADKLYEHDTDLTSKTDITSKLTFPTPSGVEGLSNGSILVISRTGALNVSVDEALNFTSLSAVAPLQNCQRRLLRTLGSDPSIKASACFRSSYVSYTNDAGATWTEINLASYVLSSACTINDIAIVAQGATNKVAIACSGRESLLFTIPPAGM